MKFSEPCLGSMSDLTNLTNFGGLGSPTGSASDYQAEGCGFDAC